MKFWDTSAIVPLLVEEPASAQVDSLLLADPHILVWWGTSIECTSAITRLEQEAKLNPHETEEILSRLAKLRDCWREIQPGTQIKQLAERILRVHPLRAQDAQQLAAALLANRDQVIEFATLDSRLELAAKREGLVCCLSH